MPDTGSPTEHPILNVAVFGAGAFGQNHVRVYRELQNAGLPVALAAVVEPDPARAAALQAQYGVPVFAHVEECLAAPGLRIDAASVCVPTSLHFAVASALLRAGIDVLVEKPIAATLEEADALVELAATRHRILQVGHLERFNPAITAVEPHLNCPMFFEVHRLSVFTPRALDVDVVLDLMIHDLDIVLSFARSTVREVRAVGLPILSPRVDIANVRLEFESGAVANFTASRVSTERVRKLRFFQPRQYVSIDYARKDLLVINVDKTNPGSGANLGTNPGASPGTNPSPAPDFSLPIPSLAAGLSFKKPAIAPGEPLRLEIESFLAAVRERSRPRVSAEDGRAALALALEINRAIAAHLDRTGLNRFHL
ncbi:MAG TPA: Gfo/Idh/MocA family oxidoreductase [Acidisarcina sp.]|nr:Gfo/Idh/MocA family oxidoreductase [Acidisarcina sp.]